jgi:hypothetical protein
MSSPVLGGNGWWGGSPNRDLAQLCGRDPALRPERPPANRSPPGIRGGVAGLATRSRGAGRVAPASRGWRPCRSSSPYASAASSSGSCGPGYHAAAELNVVVPFRSMMNDRLSVSRASSGAGARGLRAGRTAYLRRASPCRGGRRPRGRRVYRLSIRQVEIWSDPFSLWKSYADRPLVGADPVLHEPDERSARRSCSSGRRRAPRPERCTTTSEPSTTRPVDWPRRCGSSRRRIACARTIPSSC